MRKFRIDFNATPAELRAGLTEIVKLHPRRFVDGMGGKALQFHHEPDASNGLAVTHGRVIRISYRRMTDAFRALGRLLGANADDHADFAETCRFDLTGLMIDVSRNGTLRVDVVRSLLCRYALMGLNMVILYTEDSYEVPGEPFFGYLRGRYTQDELRELDAYAAALGIEMFPCIQTLAHLEQVLQWPAYAEYRDTEHVLMADEPATYALIEKMIAAATAPFRSRRIHLGMDEAHGIGTGKYLQKHGRRPPFDILSDHLGKVREICARQGLKPMIWGDMFFRLGSKTHDYYDRDAVVPAEVVGQIPRDVQLVYWDYYHMDPADYTDMIDRHRAIGFEPILATGVWCWDHFWTALPFTFRALDAGMAACRDRNLREVFVTLWGDGGMECDFYSSLPGVQYFAEHAYADGVDPDRLRANFRGSCAADFDDWVMACDLDNVPGLTSAQGASSNITKWLLWQDPLLAIMDPTLEGVEMQAHYEQLAARLAAASRKGGDASRLRFPAVLASVLALKAHLRRDLAAAYNAGDRERLRSICDTQLKTLIRNVRKAWKCHRDMWMQTYQPFGWEPIDRRYGGILTRLETVADRVNDYIAGRINAIPELQAQLHRVITFKNDKMNIVKGARVFTPSFIK